MKCPHCGKFSGTKGGRPRNALNRSRAKFTLWIRKRINAKYDGNVSDAAREMNLAYPTVRDWYIGRTVEISPRMAKAIGYRG